MKNLLYRLAIEEEGPTAVEYAVMLALILLACVGAITVLGNATSGSLEYTVDEIDNAMAS